MKYLIPFLFVLAGCITNPETGETEVDWLKVDALGDEIVVALDDQAALWAHEEGTAAVFEDLSEVVSLLDMAVHAYAVSGEGSLEDIEDYLEAAILLADTLKGEVNAEEDPSTFAAISGVRTLLGLVRVALI